MTVVQDTVGKGVPFLLYYIVIYAVQVEGRKGSTCFLVVHNSENLPETDFTNIVAAARTMFIDLRSKEYHFRVYYGIATFSNDATITLDPFNNTETILKNLRGLTRQGVGTNVTKAISTITNYITKTRWQRPRDVFPPIIIVVTGDNGHDIVSAQVQAFRAQTEGIIVMIVGLKSVDGTTFLDIASRPDYINVMTDDTSPDVAVQTTINMLFSHEGSIFTEANTSNVSMDLAFVLDNNILMSPTHFHNMKMIANNLVNHLISSQSPLYNSPSVGIISYSDRPRIVRRLRPAEDLPDVFTSLDTLDQQGNGSQLDQGLDLLDGIFGWYTDNHLQRPNYAVLFVTDDLPNWEQTKAKAEKLKSIGIQMITVGFGEASPDDISELASNVNLGFVVCDGCNVNDTALGIASAIQTATGLPKFDSCSQLFVDMALVVDISPEQSKNIKGSLSDFLLDIDLEFTRLSVITYDTEPTIQRSFNTIGNRQRRSSLSNVITNLDLQTNSDMNMTEMLILWRDSVFSTDPSERAEAHDVVLYITDREMERTQGDNVALQEIRGVGIHVMVIGVGVQESSLSWLVSDPRAVVVVSSVDLFTDALRTTRHLLCPDVCSRDSLNQGDSCFDMTIGSTLSWQSTNQKCRDVGKSLPVMSSPDVETFIRSSFFFWPEPFYFGLKKTTLTDATPYGDFRWLDGKPLVYSNWSTTSTIRQISQPDGGFLELCHYSGVDGWHDVGCAKVISDINAVLCVSQAGTVTPQTQAPRLPEVVKRGLNEKQLAYLYTCDNGELTSRHFRCNGVSDCTDGSDESDCSLNAGDECRPGEYLCDNGRCVTYDLYCDTWDDCGDNSDEQGCANGLCEPGSLQCENGQCVPGNVRCDLVRDCADGSDEVDCSMCSDSMVTCYDGTCIPLVWVKDGVTDCGGNEAEDERFLGVRTRNGETSAKTLWLGGSPESKLTNNGCLFVPDGYGRYLLYETQNRTSRPTNSVYKHCEASVCGAGKYKCVDSFCILSANVCDGRQDCPGGDDELHCADLLCPSYFRCRNSTRCLHPGQVCDRHVDCPRGDDERLCSQGAVTLGAVSTSDNNPELSRVTQLDISGSRLSLNDVVLSHPLFLARLNMSRSLIKYLSKQLWPFENLAEIDLSHNGIESVKKIHFGNNKLLKVLDLSFNRYLKTINTGAFKRNMVLRKLYLNNCALQNIQAFTFSGLSRLKHLDLSFNVITSIDDNAFKSLAMLETLKLKGNPISEFSTGVFNGLQSLQYLTADNYILCCSQVKPASLTPGNCHTPRNSLSSCEELLQNDVLKVFIWVLGVMALAGNLAVFLYRVIADRKVLKYPYGTFLLSLAVSDSCMGVYLVIVASADVRFRGRYIWHDSTWRSSTWCQIAGFLSTLSSEASAIFICLITLDRLLVIKNPFRNVSFKKSTNFMTNAFAWTVASVIAVIPLLPWNATWRLYGQNGACLPLPLTSERLPGWEYSTAIFIGFNLVTFLVIAAGQCVIYRTLKSGSIVKTKQRQSQDMVVARRLSLVVLTDFICWFPVCIMGVMALNGTVISGAVYAWTAVFVLPINSAINPLLYTVPAMLDVLRNGIKSRKRPKMRQTMKSTEEDRNVTEPTGLSTL